MPETKLIFAHVSGKRTYDNARKLLSMVRKRSDKSIPYFSTDGYDGYEEAILSVYRDCEGNIPDNLCYAQVQKKIEKNRCVDVSKEIIIGNNNLLSECIEKSEVSFTVNTSFIERSNLSMRQHNKRIERKSQGFSKRKYYFEMQRYLTIAYYNFCLPNRNLNYYKGDKMICNTPAMETGLTDHVWSMEELLSFITF